MKITSDKKNDLLKRREVLVEMEMAKTPSFAEVGEKLSEILKSSADLISIKSIKGGFGSNSFNVDAFVYSSAEDKKKYEPKAKVKKDAAAGGKK